ncbi:hypothetical protein J6590_095030 [Homalodisca vitripennis]|nr:hypothetical protein J6590_054645 [Homalodisca vitripennis]KAG8275025.1 hypothetical protein J6590_095030 [Homalodisca vitripennis]
MASSIKEQEEEDAAKRNTPKQAAKIRLSADLGGFSSAANRDSANTHFKHPLNDSSARRLILERQCVTLAPTNYLLTRRICKGCVLPPDGIAFNLSSPASTPGVPTYLGRLIRMNLELIQSYSALN